MDEDSIQNSPSSIARSSRAEISERSLSATTPAPFHGLLIYGRVVRQRGDVQHFCHCAALKTPLRGLDKFFSQILVNPRLLRMT